METLQWLSPSQFPNSWSIFFLDSSIRWLTDLLPGHSRNAKSKYSQKLDRFFSVNGSALRSRHWYAALESWNTQLRQMRKSSLQPWQLSLRPGRPSSSNSFPQLWQCRFIRSMTCRQFGKVLDWAYSRHTSLGQVLYVLVLRF